MSAALAGTNAAAATKPATANAVQCFTGSLHVCGQRPARTKKGPPPLPLCPIARAAAVALKDALHVDLGHFCFVKESDVAVSDRLRMSPFYKASVTLI